MNECCFKCGKPSTCTATAAVGEKCKYNWNGLCKFYSIGSGDDIDKPCHEEEELIKVAVLYFVKKFNEIKKEQRSENA